VVSDLGATPVLGDLTDVQLLRSAMAEAQVVYHAAGVNALCPRSPKEMFLTNVVGTRHVVDAAADAGVGRVVLTSSVSAGEPITSAYGLSKTLGEVAGFERGETRGVEVVAVRPASVQGPGRVDGSARLLLYLLRTQRPWIVEATISIVDVDDCAESHLRAAQRGEPGRAYVVSSGTVGTSEVAALLSDAVGREVRPRSISREAAFLLGFLPAMIGDVWPGGAPLCREALKTMLAPHRHDGLPAARTLGFSYRPVGATLARAAEWYQRAGLI
jgi:dihydroflavonol-4-reductase